MTGTLDKTRPAAPPPVREIELQLPAFRNWGVSPLLIDTRKNAGPDIAHWDEPAEPVTDHVGQRPAKLAHTPEHKPTPAWIGSEPKRVVIGGRSYRLSFVYLGASTGDDACIVVDPSLPVNDSCARSGDDQGVLATYGEFDPAARRAFLEWHDGGRSDVRVPEPFLLHITHSLEIAIVVDERHDVVPAARAAIEDLMRLHPHAPNFRTCAAAFLELCDWIDPSHICEPVFASGEGNHLTEMPFAVRRYLGEAIARSACLEADAALLFLLKQPGTRLDSHIAQHFEILYRQWVENYSYRFNGGVDIGAAENLSLDYECLDGTRAELRSNIPDPASALVPSGLQDFFDECCVDLEELRGLSVAERAGVVKRLAGKPLLRSTEPELSLRSDFETRLLARLASPDPVLIEASVVLADLFDNIELPANKQIPVKVCRRLQRALSDIGIGFEPDVRYGLPARVRPDTHIAIFHEEDWPFEVPGDAFHLAQAALTLSAIGSSNFPGLVPLRLESIEPRLPYRHRFSDREMRRLGATFLFVRAAGEPRALLKCWSRLMKRHQRLNEINHGFGIAFHAQADSPLVKRIATAVSKALHADDRRMSDFLREVKAQAEADAATWGERTYTSFNGESSNADPNSACVSSPVSWASPLPAPKSAIAGLPSGVAEVLTALLERPCLRTKLNQIALRHGLRISGALEQLNEWSLERLNRNATRGHGTVRINPEAFEALKLLARTS